MENQSFRSVYSAERKDWFRTDAAKVLGGEFKALPVLT
jgi:hypothetical protein